MSKKLKLLCFLLLFLLVLSGCSKTEDESYVNQVQNKVQMGTKEKAKDINGIKKEIPETEDTYVPETQHVIPEQTERPLSSDERFEVNIFLSNFSEQHWPMPDEVFYAENAPADMLLRFVFMHVYINEESLYQSHMNNGNHYISLTLAEINVFTDRFFRRILNWDDVYASSFFWTDEERVYAEFNIGYLELNQITVVDTMERRPDGLYDVTFRIYRAGESNFMIEDMSYYRLTTQEADLRSDCHLDSIGSAVLRPYEIYGKKTYQLVYYTKEDVY